MAEIEKLVHETIPAHDLEEVISNTGLYYGDAARFAPNTGNHTAFVLVNLVTGHEGKTNDYMASLRAKFRQSLAGVEISFQTGGIISDVLNFGLRAPIDIQVKGPRLDLIRPVAEDIRMKVAQVADTTDVRIKQGKSYPELHINVDQDEGRLLWTDSGSRHRRCDHRDQFKPRPQSRTTGSIPRRPTAISCWRNIPNNRSRRPRIC